MTRKTKETAWNVAESHGWEYTGDMDLEHGGIFYRWPESGPWPLSDYAEAVEVIDLAGAIGAPDGAFWISQGTVYMPTPRTERGRGKVESALATCGYTLDSYDPDTGEVVIGDGCGGVATGWDAARFMLDAFNAYWGLDYPDVFPVAVGAACRDEWRDHPHCPEPDPVTLRANASLSRHVAREYL